MGAGTKVGASLEDEKEGILGGVGVGIGGVVGTEERSLVLARCSSSTMLRTSLWKK